ncbi:MAG: GNAT family N-acetyltransferase [Polyangiaceae bacterium]
MAKPKTTSNGPISLATRLATERLVLRPLVPADIPALYRALRRNADYLRPVSPAPPPEDRRVTLALATREVQRWRTLWRRSDTYALYMYPREEDGGPKTRIIGRVSLTRLTRGAFQNCYLGYFIDKDEQGKGLMTEAVRCALTFAFGPLGLHRVQAAIMPRNAPSRRVAVRCGFREEGLARRYLQIAGQWEDHEILALTSEEWPKEQ